MQVACIKRRWYVRIWRRLLHARAGFATPDMKNMRSHHSLAVGTDSVLCRWKASPCRFDWQREDASDETRFSISYKIQKGLLSRPLCLTCLRIPISTQRWLFRKYYVNCRGEASTMTMKIHTVNASRIDYPSCVHGRSIGKMTKVKEKWITKMAPAVPISSVRLFRKCAFHFMLIYAFRVNWLHPTFGLGYAEQRFHFYVNPIRLPAKTDENHVARCTCDVFIFICLHLVSLSPQSMRLSTRASFTPHWIFIKCWFATSEYIPPSLLLSLLGNVSPSAAGKATKLFKNDFCLSRWSAERCTFSIQFFSFYFILLSTVATSSGLTKRKSDFRMSSHSFGAFISFSVSTEDKTFFFCALVVSARIRYPNGKRSVGVVVDLMCEK